MSADKKPRPLEIADALRAYQQGDMDGVLVLVSREACDEGARWLERLHLAEAARSSEREHAQARLDSAVRLLTGIHALLYPPRTTHDGVTFEFHSPMVHQQMQMLSDRIRALPGELAKLPALPMGGRYASHDPYAAPPGWRTGSMTAGEADLLKRLREVADSLRDARGNAVREAIEELGRRAGPHDAALDAG